MKGIEPSSSAWKAVALPLSYTRNSASREQRVVSRIIRRSTFFIGECRIRTCEGISHQIYSLTRLTASVTPRVMNNSVSSRHAEDRRAATHWSQPTVDIAIDDQPKLVRCVPRVAMVRTLPQAADASSPLPLDPPIRFHLLAALSTYTS